MRVKTYGPANDDIPADEMFLAKIVQNAKAWGLKPGKGAHFRRNRRAVAFLGRPTDRQIEQSTSCCAVGAAMITSTDTQPFKYNYLTTGNDGKDPGCTGPGFDIGANFQNAMGCR
jgi:uncharacterized protein YjiS (DUF1127 family)